MAKKVLIIDDEKDLVDTLAFRLKANGFEVSAAFDGSAGVEKAKKENPDLIILDLMMPVMDGLEAAKRLKADTVTAMIPIIVLTAAVTPDLNKRVSSVAAVACVTKPFEPEELISEIKKALRL